MSLVLQLIVIGTSMGMLYALISMGIVLLVRAVGILNFAQGDLLSLGAFIAYTFIVKLEMSLFPSVALSLIAFGIIGVVFMFCIYWPQRSTSWPATVIISTLGAGMVIKESINHIWGPGIQPLPPLVKGMIRLLGVRIQIQYLLILVIGLCLIGGVILLFEKSYVGRAMQAAAQDAYAAELVGIPTVITIVLTYAISMILTGISGFLVAPLFFVSISLSSMMVKAFAGIVIGGYGNIKGALVGSVIVGLIEAFSVLITTTYNDACVFLALLITLTIRPQGLFGQMIEEKA